MMIQQSRETGYPLQELLSGLVKISVPFHCHVRGMTLDSRTVQPGDLFIALAGSREHGLAHTGEALARGAVAVLADGRATQLPDKSANQPVFFIEGLRSRVGAIAARLYGDPGHAVPVYAVTGTNGKTSVSQFIAQALSVDSPCGVIGTLGSGLYGDLHATGHTTPDAVAVQEALAWQRAAGAQAVVMEVSSHALEQHRVTGTPFKVAVFTNLSHEHLDYHGDMAAYASAKRRLFDSPGLQTAVFNLDDAAGARWFDEIGERLPCIGYGFGSKARSARGSVLYGSDLQLSPVGLGFQVDSPWGSDRITTALLGDFNASNLLAALGALLAGGLDFGLAVQRLKQVQTVSGRMERFGTAEQPTVVVDYAHTPDALMQVLQTLRGHCSGTLWCVFGCGGERDRGKRPLMGQLAESLADYVVLTNDNPRSENPEDILRDIQRGMKNAHAAYLMPARDEAIAFAITKAEPGDVVLIAGKGHETEQIIAGHARPFSDREEVMRNLQGGGNA